MLQLLSLTATVSNQMVFVLTNQMVYGIAIPVVSILVLCAAVIIILLFKMKKRKQKNGNEKLYVSYLLRTHRFESPEPI